MFGSRTPVALYVSLVGTMKTAEKSIADLKAEIDKHEAGEKFTSLQYHMSWHAVSLLGELTDAKLAQWCLASAPAILSGVTEQSIWTEEALNAEPAAIKWWLSVLSTARDQIVRYSNPSSRSTSPASNFVEDYERNFYAKLWQEATITGQHAVMTDLKEREAAERRKIEEQRVAEKHRQNVEAILKEAEKKARREERKAWKKQQEHLPLKDMSDKS